MSVSLSSLPHLQTEGNETIPQPKPTPRERNWFQSKLERGKRERFTEVVTVTPGLAALMLETNMGNRPFKAAQHALHVGRLQRGDFKLTHQGMAFAKTGVMNDGQHRLTAIMTSGIAASLQITFGAERDEFAVIDQMKGRGPGDVLSILGEDHYNLRAAVARMLLQIKLRSRSPDQQLVVDYAIELRSDIMLDAMRMGMLLKGVCSPTSGAVAYYWIITRTKKPLLVEQFFSGLPHGENLNGVKLKLREWLIQREFAQRDDDKRGPGKRTTRVQSTTDSNYVRAAGIINAWNSFITGKRTFPNVWRHVTQLPDVR